MRRRNQSEPQVDVPERSRRAVTLRLEASVTVTFIVCYQLRSVYYLVRFFFVRVCVVVKGSQPQRCLCVTPIVDTK